MRRLVILFLLVFLLPLHGQFAVAADYCQPEQAQPDASAVHQHEAGMDDSSSCPAGCELEITSATVALNGGASLAFSRASASREDGFVSTFPEARFRPPAE